MTNIAVEEFRTDPVPGTGFRIDWNLTKEDIDDGVHLEMGVSATTSTTAPTALGGVIQVDTLTFPALAGATAGDYIVITDFNGLTWAVALDTTGLDPAPIGAAWAAVDAARKGQADISGDVTAAQVAATVETALNALVNFNTVITTDDSAADGTMTLTQGERYSVANPVPYNADDTGVGSITTAATTPGVDSAVDIAADTITFATDPGWLTGKPVVVSSTGTAPAGLTSGNTYYAIRSSAGVYQWASSLANALAGTEINLTDQGDAGVTITGSVGASTIGYLFNSMEKMSDSELASAILNNEFYDVNLATDTKYLIAQIGLDFSTFTKARIFIKPGETFDGFTLPDELLPHLTLRIDDEAIKFTDVNITRRGVK